MILSRHHNTKKACCMTKTEYRKLRMHWIADFFTFFCNTLIPYPVCEYDDERLHNVYNDFVERETLVMCFGNTMSPDVAKAMIKDFFDPIIDLIFFMKDSNLIKPAEYDSKIALQMMKTILKK